MMLPLSGYLRAQLISIRSGNMVRLICWHCCSGQEVSGMMGTGGGCCPLHDEALPCPLQP